MKIISEEEFEECVTQEIAIPVRVCFIDEDRQPLYIFIDEKEKDFILKEAFKGCVSHFLKEQAIPFQHIRIETSTFNLNNK